PGLGHQGRVQPVPRGRDGDVGGRAAEELLEGTHLLQWHPVVEGVDVHAGPPHGDQVPHHAATASRYPTDVRTSATGSGPAAVAGSAGSPARIVSCSSTCQPA